MPMKPTYARGGVSVDEGNPALKPGWLQKFLDEQGGVTNPIQMPELNLPVPSTSLLQGAHSLWNFDPCSVEARGEDMDGREPSEGKDDPAE